MARTFKTQTPGVPRDPEVAASLAGLSEDDVLIEVAGRQLPMNDIVRGAFETSPYSAEQWNDLDAHERDDLISAKSKEIAQQIKDLGDAGLPSQADVQRRAAEAVERRRAARQAIEQGAKPEDVLPHSRDLDPAEISAPTLCRDGWLVPTAKGPLPQNFR